MRKPNIISKSIYSPLAADVEGFDSLAELALDMRWYWNHWTDDVWRQLNPYFESLRTTRWLPCRPLKAPR